MEKLHKKIREIWSKSLEDAKIPQEDQEFKELIEIDSSEHSSIENRKKVKLPIGKVFLQPDEPAATGGFIRKIRRGAERKSLH